MKAMSKKTIGIGLVVSSLFILGLSRTNAQELVGTVPNSNLNGNTASNKEISVEVNAGRGGDVYIDNTSRTLEIKTWNESKVKVVTTVFYDGDGNKLSDEEWFEKLNIGVKSLGNSVRIKAGTLSSGGSFEVMGNTYSWSSGIGDGNNSGTKRMITIYVPKENKLEIESKYSDITIDDNINKLTADITNGNLDVQDVNGLTLRSKYANVSSGNLQTAEVEFINGHFSTKEVGEIDLDTKYSTVDIASANKINLVSTNDDYDIEEVSDLQGQKNYGNLRISKLNKSIEMDGTNADIKVRSISPSTETIKFDNKYADIRLPLRNVRNYTINYIGSYSTVYGNFEKKAYTGKAFKMSSSVKETLAEKMKALNESTNGDDDNSNNKFSASVGDGRGTEIDMRCQNCTVDFK